MNLAELAKHEDRVYEMRPIPLSKIGTKLTKVRYNEWKITVFKSRGEIQIRHMATDHQLNLGLDNFHEYRSPNFLMLKCQLIFEGALLKSEPMPDPRR